jgi:hypothetical protein
VQKIAAGYTVAEMDFLVSVESKHLCLASTTRQAWGLMIGSLRGPLTCTLLSFVIRPAAGSCECRGQRSSPYNLQVGVRLRRYQHITGNTGVNREWKPVDRNESE